MSKFQRILISKYWIKYFIVNRRRRMLRAWIADDGAMVLRIKKEV